MSLLSFWSFYSQNPFLVECLPSSDGDVISAFIDPSFAGVLLGSLLDFFVTTLPSWRTPFFLTIGGIILILSVVIGNLKIFASWRKRVFVSIFVSLRSHMGSINY